MLALITGATGFLGSHVLRQWLADSHTARVLYRSPSKLRLIEDLPFEAVQGDLGDAALLEAASDGCDVVFHVAAKADYWKDSDRESLWRINVDGTRNVLAAAQNAGVARVVFTSSASAIGIRPGFGLADEDSSFNLRPQQFYYAFTKHQAEAVVAEFVAGGLDVVTLNPTVIIGPGDLNAISGSFVIETARWQWLVPNSSGGVAVIDVRDVARAHLAAVEKGRPGERYILNAANLSYSDFFGHDRSRLWGASAAAAYVPIGCWSRLRASSRRCAGWASIRRWMRISCVWAGHMSTSMAARRLANYAPRRSISKPACARPINGTPCTATSSATG